MMNTYDVGETVRIKLAVTDASSGDPYAPGQFPTFKVLAPDGTPFDPGPVLSDTTGNYRVDIAIPFDPIAVGIWRYRWEIQSTPTGAVEGGFKARSTPFYPQPEPSPPAPGP